MHLNSEFPRETMNERNLCILKKYIEIVDLRTCTIPGLIKNQCKWEYQPCFINYSNLIAAKRNVTDEVLKRKYR